MEIGINYEVTEKSYFEFLPRVGFVLKLDKKYNDLKYFAYGPQETYADSHEFALKGMYEDKVLCKAAGKRKPFRCGEGGGYGRTKYGSQRRNGLFFRAAIFCGDVDGYKAR